jgi:GT2 family glycosyltransferase/peptidoglycan/xylan/chitin deacetylase (PgdA/CDA1 family)
VISVIVPTWQRTDRLEETLNSLAREKCECEVIVVCDGPDDAVQQFARSYKKVHVEWVFHDHNLGQAAARNTGAARASGDILLFLDDDTPAEPGLLLAHANAHKNNDRIAVCGRIVESAVAPQSTKTGQFLERGWMQSLQAFEEARTTRQTKQIPSDAAGMSCFGLNCSIRKSLFQEFGGFNPALRYMEEDMELGHRLYMSGVQFVCEPSAVVYHKNTKDLVAYYRRCWWLGGTVDLLRACKFQERNEQTRHLLALDSGPLLERLAHLAFWYGNAPARQLSNILKPITELTGSRLSFRLWHDTTRLQQYWEAVRTSETSRAKLRELAGNPLRVLLLHSISTPQNAQEASYYLSPGRFRKLFDTMKSAGYNCADPLKLEHDGAQWGPRDFVLTFDDGYDDFYTEVFPLMEQYSLKPLVFLTAGIRDSNRWDQANGLRARTLLTAAQIAELQRHGVRFGSHTLTHPSLPDLDDRQLQREVADSRHQLEDLLGEQVNTFAYPFGYLNQRVRAAVIEAGYKLAFTTVPGMNHWQDPYAIRRTEFNEVDSPSFDRWKLRTWLNPRQTMKYELDPLLNVIPSELRKPLRDLRERLRPGAKER